MSIRSSRAARAASPSASTSIPTMPATGAASTARCPILCAALRRRSILPLLEKELSGFLHELQHGDFMQRVPPEARRINDIAISGNGEPTSAQEFAEVIELIARLQTRRSQAGAHHQRQPHAARQRAARPAPHGATQRRSLVQAGSRQRRRHAAHQRHQNDDGQSAAEPGHRHRLLPQHLAANLLVRAGWRGTGRQDEDDYVDFLKACCAAASSRKACCSMVLARPSLQAEAPRLSALSSEQMERFAARIRACWAWKQKFRRMR